MKQIIVLGLVILLLLPVGACGKRPINLTHLPAPWPTSPAETVAATPKATETDVQIWYTPNVQVKTGFLRWETSDGEVEVSLDSFLENAPLLPLKKILLAQSFYRNDFDLLTKNFPVGFLHLRIDSTQHEQWQRQWPAHKNRPASGQIHLELTINPGDQEFIADKDTPPLLSLFRYNPKLQTFHLLATDFFKDGLLNPHLGKVSVHDRYYFDSKNIKAEDLRQLLENQEQLFFAWNDLSLLNPPAKKESIGFCFQNNLQVNCFNVHKNLTAEELIHRLTSDYQLINQEQLASIGALEQPQGKWNFWQPVTKEEKEMNQWLFGTRNQPINNYLTNFEHYPFLMLIHTSYLQLMDKLSFQLQKEERFSLTSSPANCQVPTLGKLHVLIAGTKKVPTFQENILRPLVFSLVNRPNNREMGQVLGLDKISFHYQGVYTDFLQWQTLPLESSDLLFSIGGRPVPWVLNQWIPIDPLLPVPQPVQVQMVPSPPMEKSIGFQRWEGTAPSDQLGLQSGNLSQETKKFPIELQGQLKCQFFSRF